VTRKTEGEPLWGFREFKPVRVKSRGFQKKGDTPMGGFTMTSGPLDEKRGRRERRPCPNIRLQKGRQNGETKRLHLKGSEFQEAGAKEGNQGEMAVTEKGPVS